MASTFKRFFKQAVGVSNNTVYNPTTAGIQSTIIGFSVSNRAANTITVSATLSANANSASAGANSVYLAKDVTIPVGTTIVLVGGDQKVVVSANDFLEVSSNTAGSADVLLSVLEIV